jgi:Zn-dependent peptidase ImmA (M78 family)
LLKPDFEKCSALATELLYQQDIRDRILDIRELQYDKNIIFDTIQNYAFLTKTPISLFLSNENNILKDGCTLVLGNDNYLVLYNNQTNNFHHLNWTLAHEVGHVYLNHSTDGPLEEIEAHFFAAQLFMPEYSLYMMAKKYGTIYEKDLVEIFGVSESAADKRLRTMQKKTSFRASKIDKEIWDIQKERVALYHDCFRDRHEYRFSLDFLLYIENEYSMMRYG